MANGSMTKSGRNDGRHVTTPGFVHHLLSQPGELSYQKGMGSAELQTWRKKVRRKLKELLAFPRVDAQPAPKKISDEPRDGYHLQKWELYPEPHCVVPFLMLVPDGASAATPAPAVLCIPGSQQPKEALCGEPWTAPWVNLFGEHNLIALHMVKAGFVAVAFDNPGTCELAHEDNRSGHSRNSEQLIWLGRTYEGMSTFHKWCALQWLRQLKFVNKNRIAACGHSLGAKPALLLGVLESSIKAVVWNDAASNWRQRDCVTNLSRVAQWHYIPGFARWFDYMDLMSALAPKPLLITEGGRLDDHALIRDSYRAAGASDSIKVSFMPNFSRSKNRNRKKIPQGIKPEDYGLYANYDGDHYFKDEVVIPWLKKLFSK